MWHSIYDANQEQLSTGAKGSNVDTCTSTITVSITTKSKAYLDSLTHDLLSLATSIHLSIVKAAAHQSLVSGNISH